MAHKRLISLMRYTKKSCLFIPDFYQVSVSYRQVLLLDLGVPLSHLIDFEEKQHGAALFLNPVLVPVSSEQLQL